MTSLCCHSERFAEALSREGQESLAVRCQTLGVAQGDTTF